MQPDTRTQMRDVALDSLGERLSVLRLCGPDATQAMRRSLEQYGQLTTITMFRDGTTLEIVDGFKRVRAARELGLHTLSGCVFEIDSVEAKLRLRALQLSHGLTELEEGWLVRSLHRDDGLPLPAIALQLQRHKSWVWRRLMLVEALLPDLQTDVRLGLLAPRAAVAVSRLPRGNQKAAAAVVMQRGMTVPQTELLVAAAITQPDDHRAAWLVQRLHESAPLLPGPRPQRRARSELQWLSTDIAKVHELAVRLTTRLYDRPLSTLTHGSADLLRGALHRLAPVLRVLVDVVDAAGRKDSV